MDCIRSDSRRAWSPCAGAGAYRVSRTTSVRPTGSESHCRGTGERGVDGLDCNWDNSFLFNRSGKAGFIRLPTRFAAVVDLRHGSSGGCWTNADGRAVMVGLFPVDGAGVRGISILLVEWI